ncbi:hypothetical protein DSECCO2_403830 [anaerobic digester metagenome]
MVEERERNGVDRQWVAGDRDETVRSYGDSNYGDQDEQQEEECHHVILVAYMRPDDREEREDYQERCYRREGDLHLLIHTGMSRIPGEREVEQNLHDGDDREKENCK